MDFINGFSSDFLSKFAASFVKYLPLLLSIPFILLAAILIPVFAFRGYKRGLWLALVSLGASAVAYLTSVFVTKPVAALIGERILDAVLGNVGNKSEGIDLSAYPAVRALSLAFAAFAVSAVLFLLVFLVFLLIFKNVARAVLKKKLSSGQSTVGMRIGGLFVRLLDGALVAACFLIPLYSLVFTGATAVEKLTEDAAAADESFYTEQAAFDCADLGENAAIAMNASASVADSPVIRILGNTPLGLSSRHFASFGYNGDRYDVRKFLIETSESGGKALKVIVTDPVYRTNEDLDGVRKLKNTLTGSDLYSELVKDASGIVLFSAKELPSVASDVLLTVKNGDPGEVKDALGALLDSYEALLIEKTPLYGRMSGQLYESLRNEKLVYKVDLLLRSSAILSSIEDRLLSYGITEIRRSASEQNTNAPLITFLTRITERIGNPTIDPDKEASKESAALYRILGSLDAALPIIRSDGDFDIRKLDTGALSDFLIGMALHPYIGEKNADYFISEALPGINEDAKSLLNAKAVASLTNALHKDLAALEAGGEPGALENILRSLQNVVLTLDGMKNTDKESVKRHIGLLMDEMTADTASAIGDALTGDAIGRITGGAGDSGSAEIADFIGSLLNNIAENENTERDRDAVTEVTTILLDYRDHGADSTFEDAVGGDLKSFFETIVDSDLAVKTVKESVDRSGDDPLGCFTALTKEDKDAVLSACGEILGERVGETGIAERLDVLLSFFGVH